jgi:hypothetical protein
LRFSLPLTLVGLPFRLDAQILKERPKVFVSVVNDTRLNDAIVLLAETMASQIFEQAGLVVIWRSCLATAWAET